MVICSLEQWKIHKLDSAYECHVMPEPKFTYICINSKWTTGNTTMGMISSCSLAASDIPWHTGSPLPQDLSADADVQIEVGEEP